MTALSLALLSGATPLAWYTFFEPSIRDTAVFAVAAWLVALVKPDNVIRAGRRVRAFAWVGLGVIPFIVLWVTLASAPDGSSLHVLDSRWMDVLFSSWHGFLSWTPVAYVAVIGTVAYYWRDRAWSLAALAIVLGSAWLAGASQNWMGGPAFGARHLIALLAVLAPGLACAIDALRRRPAVALAPLVAMPIMWNHLLMVQYTVGLLPKDEPVSFARMVRQQADAYASGIALYPFAFPANLWFAWREGVGVDRYDLLATEPRRSSVDLVMDRSAARFLLDGWEVQTKDDWGPLWWINGAEASAVLPLALPPDRDVELIVKARTRFEEPTVQADLGLHINGHQVGEFSPSATSPSEARFVVRAGGTHTVWREGLNRISIVSRGVHRVDPSDTRPPGAIGSRPGNQTWPVAIYRITIAPRS